ncbi:MAG: helix-turn-helix domain-containing protein [Ekhidna sp.]
MSGFKAKMMLSNSDSPSLFHFHIGTILDIFQSNPLQLNNGNFLDLLILFGALQGFITATLLFSKKRHQSSHLLASILLIISLACLNIYLFEVLPPDVPTAIRILEKVVPLIIIMPLGPLIYFHVRSLAGMSFSFKASRAHFFPTILDLIPSLVFLIATILYAFNAVSSFQPIELEELNLVYEKYVDVPRWLSTSIYLVLTIRYVSKKRLAQTKWVKQFLGVFMIFQIVWLFHLIPYLLPSTSNWLLSYLGWYPIYIPLTILVYWLGINGLVHLKSHRVSTLDEEQMERVVNSLNKVMEKERLYLDASLSLNIIVEKTGLLQKEISGALNQYLGKSFNEWINEYRVNEVKRKLVDPSFAHLSITGVALESGFNSQATFQRAFKAITGKTPKSFRASANIDS